MEQQRSGNRRTEERTTWEETTTPAQTAENDARTRQQAADNEARASRQTAEAEARTRQQTAEAEARHGRQVTDETGRVPHETASGVVEMVPAPPSAAQSCDPPVPDPIPPVPPPLATLDAPVPVDVPESPPAAAPSAHTVPTASAVQAPTLRLAFVTLCAALSPHLMENAPAYAHCQEIQSWHTANPMNMRVAWGHAVRLLEGVLGGELTQGFTAD